MPFFALRYGLIENKDIGLALSASLALPALVDLSTMLGASLSIGNLFFIDAGWRWSLSNALNYFDGGSDKALYAFQALPSISVRLNADTFLRLGSYGASFGLTSRPIAASVYAAEASLQLSAGSADLEGPRISIGTDNKAIWSEALHAEAAFSLSIQDASRLVSWSVLAYDQEGKSIFKIGEDSSLIEKAAKSRLLSVKKNLYPPKGFAIPLAGLDGSYRIRGSARDEYGNEAKSQEFEFIVDSKAPTATVSLASPAIFTPNGDGRRDLLSVEQSGSQERLWKGSFLDAGGRIVKNLSWSEGKPENFAWDGRDDGGNIVPDGKYSYELSSIDEAGNRGTAVISGIIIDAEKPSLDISLSSRILSSEGELRFSSITATIQLSSSRSLDSWTISVIDEKGKSQRSWKGEKAKLELFPTSLRFDGRTAQGDYLADGQYRFRAELFYANGNTPLATSTSFLIDSEKPSGRVRSSVNVINPERGISTELFHDLSSLSTWRGLVLDSDDKIVKSFDIKGAGESSLSWDGLSDEREPLPEGTYHYLAEGRSQAGLVSRTSSVNIKIEKGGLEAALMVDRPLFSSRVGEGKIRFLTRIEKRERILSYSLEIGSSTQALVRRFEGLANVPAALAWDGRDDFGVLVPDGRYQAKLRLQLDGSSQAGASIETAPAQFTIDSTPPEAKVQLVNQLFSPNGNSKLDSILIHQETSAEEVWLGKIIDEKGGIARSYSWKTRPPASLQQDGTTAAGQFSPMDCIATNFLLPIALAMQAPSPQAPSAWMPAWPLPASVPIKLPFLPTGMALPIPLACNCCPPLAMV
ncbi:hypothetical protein MASR2M78_15980 [Treponema sp.]